jgi:uncharacterized protein YcfJ
MKAIKLAGLVLSGLSLAALSACNESEAQVASGAAANTTVAAKKQREVCTDEVVTTEKPSGDKNRVIGTVAGALVGGVVGNKVGGKGTSEDIATVGGAVAGGYAGNRVQKSMQDNRTETTVKRTCRMVDE